MNEFIKLNNTDESQTQKCGAKCISPRKMYIIGYHFLYCSKEAKLSNTLFRQSYVCNKIFLSTEIIKVNFWIIVRQGDKLEGENIKWSFSISFEVVNIGQTCKYNSTISAIY